MRQITQFLRDLPAWIHVSAFAVTIALVSVVFGRGSNAAFVVVLIFILTLVPRGWSEGLDVFGVPIGTALLLKLVEPPAAVEYAILIGVSTLLALWILDRDENQSADKARRGESNGRQPAESR